MSAAEAAKAVMAKLVGIRYRLQRDETLDLVVHRMAELLAEETMCKTPPPGWFCTRGLGHEGPCAAHPGER